MLVWVAKDTYHYLLDVKWAGILLMLIAFLLSQFVIDAPLSWRRLGNVLTHDRRDRSRSCIEGEM